MKSKSKCLARLPNFPIEGIMILIINKLSQVYEPINKDVVPLFLIIHVSKSRWLFLCNIKKSWNFSFFKLVENQIEPVLPSFTLLILSSIFGTTISHSLSISNGNLALAHANGRPTQCQHCSFALKNSSGKLFCMLHSHLYSFGQICRPTMAYGKRLAMVFNQFLSVSCQGESGELSRQNYAHRFATDF